MWPYVMLVTYTMKILLLHNYYPLGICSKYNIWIDHNGRDLAAIWGILSVSFLCFSFLFKPLSLCLSVPPCLSVSLSLSISFCLFSLSPSLWLYLSISLSVCVVCLYVCLWRVEFNVECLPPSLSSLFYWDRLSHWTRRSQIQWG